nr:hypothetical protein [Trentepohlia sp. YN1317]
MKQKLNVFENSQAEAITNDDFLKNLTNSSENLQLYNKKFADFINNNIQADNISKLSQKETKLEYEKLSKINSKEEFVNHLTNSSLGYNKIGLWVLENQNFIKFKTLTEKHHFIPLHTILGKPELTELIQANYNLLFVSRSVHLYLHAVRFLQFFEINDYKTLKLSSILNTTISENTFDKEIYKTIKNSFTNFSVETERIKQEEYLAMSEVYLNMGLNAIENSLIFSQIFANDMIWVNKKESLRIMIPKGQVKTILQLVEKLHYMVPESVSKINIKDPKIRHNYSDYMRTYLKGVDRSGVLMDFYNKDWYLENLNCKERNKNRKPFEGKVHGGVRESISLEHKILLQNSVFFYKNNSITGHFEFQFDNNSTYWDLANELAKLMPETDLPNSWFQGDKNKRYFVKRVKELINNKRNTAYGWKIEKIENFIQNKLKVKFSFK